jgi:hypothetical protein
MNIGVFGAKSKQNHRHVTVLNWNRTPFQNAARMFKSFTLKILTSAKHRPIFYTHRSKFRRANDIMVLTTFSNKFIEPWQDAVDRTTFSPSPMGGPEYASTMKYSWNKTYIFQHGDLFMPFAKSRTKHFGIISSNLYCGVRNNSLLGLESIDADSIRALKELPEKCCIHLHVPEELYLPHKEIFESLYFYPLEKYPYYKISLPDSFEEWYSRPGICRCNIRRALEYGVEVAFGGLELLETFYELFLCSFRRWKKMKWAKRPYEFKRFQRMFDLPGSRTKVAVAYYTGIPIAAAIFCHYRKIAGALNAGTDYEYQKIRPTNLLHAEIIRYLIYNGVAEYNLGGLMESGNLRQFKKSLGASEHTSYLLCRHRFPRLKRFLRILPCHRLA